MAIKKEKRKRVNAVAHHLRFVMGDGMWDFRFLLV